MLHTEYSNLAYLIQLQSNDVIEIELLVLKIIQQLLEQNNDIIN